MSERPCVRCEKRSACFGFCHAFELYLTMRNTRLIRISCSKEACPLTRKFIGGLCMLYCDGECLAYRYVEWRVVAGTPEQK
jgi:hypothetical protein